MLSRSRALAVTIVAIVASAGCLFPSLDDYLGAASTIDAGVDAGSEDAPASDTSAPADAHTSRFCASLVPAPTYCEDYDSPDASSLTAFGNVNVNGGGQVSLDKTFSLSGARSLLCSIPVVPNGNQAAAMLSKSVSSTAFSAMRFEIDMALDPGDNLSSLGGIYMQGAEGIGLVTGPLTLSLQEGGWASNPNYVNHNQHDVAWTAGSWHHIAFTLKQVPPTSSMSIDGVLVETTALDSRFTFTKDLAVSVGFGYVGGPAAARSAHFDNVVIQLTP